jgi:hypothetical protein
VPFALILALALVAALLTARSAWRRAVGLLVAASMLAVPWLAAWPITRGALALGGVAALGRVIDLYRKRRNVRPMRRVWHVLSTIDSWQARSATPGLDTRAAGRVLLWAAVATLGLWLVRHAPLDGGLLRGWGVRWAGGLLLVYGLADAIHAGLAVLYRLGGRAIPAQHRTPLAARSIQEFWGARWNLTVSSWLYRNIFHPLARRGRPALGIALSFAVSAAIHAYVALAAAGPKMALWMGVYFLMQGLFVLLERPLGVSHWDALGAHVWVTTVMILSSPLFVEPFLRVMGLEH